MKTKKLLIGLLSGFLAFQSSAQNNFTDLKVDKQVDFNTTNFPKSCARFCKFIH